MAHIMEETKSLKIEHLFVDGDTRTTTLKNPRPDISNADITDLQTFLQQNNALIGDKHGGTYGRIESVKSVVDYKVKLDLS